MVYKVVRSEHIDLDLDLIFNFLLGSALEFGESPEDAFNRAEKRLMEIENSLEDLIKVPHQGTREPHLGDSVRHFTKNRAIIYFEVDDETEIVRILAVFFGGQDHDARILLRLLS